MVGFQSPCVYIWLILFCVKTNGEDVDVLVLLPKDNSYLFSISMVRPAIEYAKKMIKLDTGFYSGLNFSVQYENSGCGSNALFSLVDRAFKKKPDLILGPVCEYAAADVVRMASHWDIPVISAGALAVGFKRKEGDYSHLTRIAPSYLKMAEIFSAMFHRFKWQNVLLVFDDDKEERNCYFTAEAVHSVLEPEELSMSVHVINSKHYNVDTDEIMNRISESQVVIMCAGNDIIRDIMLAAYWRKLTNASYIYFSIELFNSSSYGNGSWKRGDRYDSEAKQAFASLNTVTLLRTVKPEFESFSIEMMKSVNSAGVLDQYSGDNMNVFMEGFHDALHLYALALHDIMKNGSDKKDGKQITQNMWNRTFEGIAGQVSIDSNGDRNGDFSVMTMMDPEDGTYKAVLNYFGANGSLQTLPGFSSNRFTLTERYETPNPDKSSGGLEVSTVTCISVGAVMSTLLVMAVYFFRKKYKIIIERQCQQEQHSLRKHHHLREDTIAFSMA
ncbi:atrial natriuretic peptide receptor 3-like isoform X3 [Paramormyrops kingsleyae]|uniref:atrial natriuretic peptide receptor 3-like isoform X3 n=1 Tax=Paramormyrops kingsleyae TaxID=1676925 RepID=UPI000CD61EF3|nr:atrial natriuretic peptide receptor 3-like isoform X3 [Paramormyrops kingsleyae]